MAKQVRHKVEQIDLFAELEQAKTEILEEQAMWERKQFKLYNLAKERREELNVHWKIWYFIEKHRAEIERYAEEYERGVKVL